VKDPAQRRYDGHSRFNCRKRLELTPSESSVRAPLFTELPRGVLLGNTRVYRAGKKAGGLELAGLR
jgi:hypothetical protein